MATAIKAGKRDVDRLLGRGVADDDADVGDARFDQVLDAVEEHRLVGHRDELLR